jgi:multidrug efflux pump subunit AcrA (membrane-fusion protein)
VRRSAWALTGAAVLVAACGAKQAGPAAKRPPANTAAVERGALSSAVSTAGILTYRARPDGSPYPAVNQARGIYTALPGVGDKIDCGDVLYRVDDEPVLLLCGAVPAYRGLRTGDKGKDVRQLNRTLGVAGTAFTARTRTALTKLQRAKGAHADGALAFGDAVFLPAAVRIAKVSGQVGGSARPGAPVLEATSDTLHVQVNLDPSQQGEVEKGDRAQITLPGNTPLTGRVAGFGRTAQTPPGQAGTAADATIPTFVSLDDPAKAGGLDKAPVDVDITTKGVDSALSVPVTALVGRSGGGYAVEVVRPRGQRRLVAVRLGLFDTGSGRVQVEGRLTQNDLVVVPSI